MTRIGIDESNIVVERVHLDGERIGLIGADIAHRPPHARRRWRRNVRDRSFRRHQLNRLAERGLVPRRLLPIGQQMCAAANVRERGFKIDPRRAQHFGNRGGVSAIGAGPVRHDRPGRGRERNQHALQRLDRLKTARQSPALRPKWQLPRGVDHHNLGARPRIGERTQQVRQSHRFDRDVALA